MAVRKAEEFAAGVISTGAEDGFCFSRDERTCWFVRGAEDEKRRGEVMESRHENGAWTEPIRLLSDRRLDYRDPTIGPRDAYMLFSAPPEAAKRMHGMVYFRKDLHVGYRIAGKWYPPRPIGRINILDHQEVSPHVTQDGTLYFASDRPTAKTPKPGLDIYMARSNESGWGVARPVAGLGGPGDQFDPFIRLGGFILFAQRPTADAPSDLHVSYWGDETWSEPQALSRSVNTSASESSPYVSRDGMVLYFTRAGRIFRINLADALPSRGR